MIREKGGEKRKREEKEKGNQCHLSSHRDTGVSGKTLGGGG